MSSAKLQQISRDIEVARCKGNWQAIPELARRYKKYNPDGTVTEQTILAEASLSQLVASQSVADYSHDSPTHISLDERLDPNAIKSVQNQLRAVLQLPDDQNHPQKEFANIVMARSYFECGEYEKTLEIVEKLSFNREDVSEGYGFVLFLQARTVKAISLEILGNIDAALQSYEGIVNLLNEGIHVPRERVLADWAENALYRGSLLALREGSILNTSSILEILRAYQKLTATQSTSWRISKRMVITRYSLRFLSDAYKRGDYTPPADAQSGESTNEGPQYDRQMFTMESVQLHTIYEKMLFSQTSFPRAGELNDLMNEYVDQLANDFEVIGLTTQDLWGFVEVLDRAAQKTFNSPRITRHLFHALVRLGEYEEACHALHSYMYLVGLTSQAWEESRLNSEALATDTQGRSIPIPNINEDVDEITDQGTTEEGEPPHSIASMRSPEKEAPQDTIRVLLTAVKMYCKELRQGVQAVEIAEIARSIMKKLPKKDAQHTEESWNTLSAQVYRAVGVAYSLLACQTYDPALRPNYHKRASKYLTLSNQLDPNVWETYYQMALQQADMRDIRQAVQSITKALQANPTHVPSWHLLTLACSCPIQNDFQQALKTCEMGLQYSQPETTDDVSQGNGLDNKINGTHDECEQQILLQMTHTMLLDAVEGPDAALELQEALFTTYAKISNNDTSTSTTNSVQDSYHQAQNGMVISGSLGNLSEVQLAEQKRRGRSASSSVVGSERTDQLAMPASRSHDNVHGNSTLASRAHSVSSFQGPEAGNKLAVPSEPAVHKHHHLHLFGSRSSSRRMKKDDAASEKESVHKNASTGTLSPNVYENRVYQSLNNSATSLHSTAPSIVNVKGILQPSSIPTRPTTRSRLRQQRSKRILSNLWLLSASSFLNAGKLDEALKAIEEAENVDWTTNPRVWYLLGRFRLQENQPDQAIAAFEKGLVANPMDIECRVWLAKTHMEMGALELAEGILDMLTKGNGWDCAEAWFYLGEVYRRTDRVDQTKDCLFYALDLENTRPIQPFSVLPRCV